MLDTAFTQSPRTLVLNGTYSFDAIANDGQTLYLIEHLPVEQVEAALHPRPQPHAALRRLYLSARSDG